MFIPIRTDVPLRRTPWMNWLLIALNVICYIAQRYAGDEAIRPLLLNPRNPHLYEFFTYQFLHGSGLHILGNMLFLYIFGNNVNDRMGQLGYLGFYLGGGVFAGIAHVLTASTPVLGASGSIAAVTGAYMVLLPRSHVTIFYFFYLIGTFELAGLWFVLLFFAQDVFSQFFGGLFGGQEAVAHMAHIGGTAYGFSVCMVLLWTRLLPRDMFDLFAIVDRWNRRRVHRDAVSKGFDPFGISPRQALAIPVSPTFDRSQELRAEISEAIAHGKIQDGVRLYLQLRAMDPSQVLGRQNQLDVANQLFQDQIYPAAADSYELYLRNYPKAPKIEEVQLICGLIYARYLNRPDQARPHLAAAVDKLQSSEQADLARTELARLGTFNPSTGFVR